MGSKKDFYRIFHRDGVSTSFHVIDAEMIPLANFDVAYRWFKEGVLTAKSKLELLDIMKNPDIAKRYRKFLEEENSIIRANSQIKTSPAMDKMF